MHAECEWSGQTSLQAWMTPIHGSPLQAGAEERLPLCQPCCRVPTEQIQSHQSRDLISRITVSIPGCSWYEGKRSSKRGVRLITGKIEERHKREIWEGCRSTPRQQRVYFSEPPYIYYGKQSQKLTETILLKCIQDICSHPKTSLCLPPRSTESSAPSLEPQVHLLLLFRASADREACRRTLICLDSARQEDFLSLLPTLLPRRSKQLPTPGE